MSRYTDLHDEFLDLHSKYVGLEIQNSRLLDRIKKLEKELNSVKDELSFTKYIYDFMKDDDSKSDHIKGYVYIDKKKYYILDDNS